jgi:phenol/toluene 2-monooxygenase (NADH) P0/A0
VGSPDPLAEMEPAPLDTKRRFVRITRERAGGFIEFDFAIGAPDLLLEMILDRAAFAEFCAANRVEDFPPAAAQPAAPDDWMWRLQDATQTRFK